MNAAKQQQQPRWAGLVVVAQQPLRQTDGFLDLTIGPGGPHHQLNEPVI